MRKVCVYTCITGDYDYLKEINKEKGVDYYCFTNNKKIKSTSWNVVYIEDNSLSNVKLARKIKILGHPIINDYDVLLWMDGAVEFNSSILEFINHFMKDDDVFVAFKHGVRKNIKEEAMACIRSKKDSKENIKKLLTFYEKEKYKFDNGLIESTVYIKKPKDQVVKKTMKLWFDMIQKYTHRDQLSFNYCISKTNLKIRWINEYVFNNKWFEWHNHTYKDIDSYAIYFGDNTYDYDPELDYVENYKIVDNNYVINKKVPVDTDTIIVELTYKPFIEIKEIKVSKNCENYSFVNSVLYKGKVLFYDQPGYLILKNDFKKGETIKVEIQFRNFDEVENFEYLKCLVKENGKIKKECNQVKRENKKLKEENQKLQKSVEEMINSKSWRITKPLRKISKFIRK